MMNSEQNHNSRSTCSLLGDDCDSPKSNLRASCLTIFFLRLLYLKHFFPSDIIKDILGVQVNFCCNNKQPLHLHSLQQQTHIFPLWLCVLTGGHTLWHSQSSGLFGVCPTPQSEVESVNAQGMLFLCRRWGTKTKPNHTSALKASSPCTTYHIPSHSQESLTPRPSSPDREGHSSHTSRKTEYLQKVI